MIKKLALMGILCGLTVPAMAQQYHPLKPIHVEADRGDDYAQYGLSGDNKPNGIIYRLRESRAEQLPTFLVDSKANIIDNYQSNWLVFYRKYNEVVFYDKFGEVLWELDLDDYIKEDRFEVQDIRFEDGVLYFNSACKSYSKGSKGKCSSLYALDIDSRSLLWNTDYLVSNNIFIIVDDIIVAGYGFTDEPDYLYLINKYTGEQLSKTKLNAAHSYLEGCGNLLHVITYNKYYLFDLKKYLNNK